ncbi:putative glycoside hydrolase [Helicovermis profundi]|uniref:Glycoside hydrolase n=1 Tax=Helicovermis profundi TaxID=3065157 RepID=A0AAU9EKC2_9FIRM|nr:putative glycoside hydrolase [Clostridia bacterium S502]
MKKVRIGIISFFVVVVAFVLVFKITADNKKSEALEKMRSETSILIKLDKEIRIIEKNNEENILKYIEEARKERAEKVKKYIIENTYYIKSNNVRATLINNSSSEFTVFNKGDTLVLINGEDPSNVVVRKKYNDLLEYTLDTKYITKDLSEMIHKKYKNVDYQKFDKTKGYPDNPYVNVKGVYVTGHSASTKRIDKLIDLAKNTDINTFVIDVKDDNGNLLFYSKDAENITPVANKVTYIKDIESFVKKLKDNNIYLIARIVSFKSPRYAKEHRDRAITYQNSSQLYVNNGMIWSSPYDRKLWEYNVQIAKDAAKVGFNEIQFDYVRFPASGGGKLDKNLDYKNLLNENKTEAIQNFLKYAYKELSPYHVYISADVFGWSASTSGDVGIGQQWEALSNVADVISPMIYPSHYGEGNYGLSVPDAFPYETVDRCVKDAIKRDENLVTPAKIRPWIQDFTAPWVKGHIKYGDNEVRLQIKALKDNNINEYILWNSGNYYHEGALTN